MRLIEPTKSYIWIQYHFYGWNLGVSINTKGYDSNTSKNRFQQYINHCAIILLLMSIAKQNNIYTKYPQKATKSNVFIPCKITAPYPYPHTINQGELLFWGRVSFVPLYLVSQWNLFFIVVLILHNRLLSILSLTSSTISMWWYNKIRFPLFWLKKCSLGPSIKSTHVPNIIIIAIYILLAICF